MRETLEAIHQMRADGVISAYAIGGAVGALAKARPSSHKDLTESIAASCVYGAGGQKRVGEARYE